MWTVSNFWDLTALAMFIWMGEILYRTKLSDDMFEGLAPWVQKLPGRLLHVNVIGCAIFAAVSGSSAATCANDHEACGCCPLAASYQLGSTPVVLSAGTPWQCPTPWRKPLISMSAIGTHDEKCAFLRVPLRLKCSANRHA
jgi:hypothetical protein